MCVLHGHNTAHSLWGKMNESHDVIVKRVTHLSILEGGEWNRELQLFNAALEPWIFCFVIGLSINLGNEPYLIFECNDF